ncbi:hypothetical protein [Roseateles sp. P5_E7]
MQSNTFFFPVDSMPMTTLWPRLGYPHDRRDALNAGASGGAVTAGNREPGSEPNPMPPMGWMSDCLGARGTEAGYLANGSILAERFLPVGYDIAMVGPQWYAAEAATSGCRPFAPLELDAHGRPQPAADRFPSAMDGYGFAPLAAQVHRLGLRFGVHVVRGIPRQAVERTLPIAGSRWRCDEIANLASTGASGTDMCSVNPDHPGAFDWYRAWFAQLAACGVDAVTVDDIASPQGHSGELGLIRRAIDATGRRIALSLSPSPTLLHQGAQLESHASERRSGNEAPVACPALRADIVNLLECVPQARPEVWPAASVLHVGEGGQDKEDGGRGERPTPDEQMFRLTAWACARRPLLLAGDLRLMDDRSLRLLTNPEVLALLRAPGRREWHAAAQGHRFMCSGAYSTWVGWLNTGDEPWSVSLPEWLPGDGRDCWARTDLPVGTRALTVPARGARLIRLGAKA